MKNIILSVSLLAVWLFSCTGSTLENNIVETGTYIDIDLVFSTSEQSEYFENIVKPSIFRLSINDTIVPKSIIVAQAMIESGNGTSYLAKTKHNHFGHRSGKHWHEYKNDYESFLFHNELLKRKYKSNGNYILWARNLEKRGYCTDEGYSDKLISTIKQYKLYKLDEI